MIFYFMPNEYFQSSDFQLSSSLICLGFSLEGIDKTFPNRCEFIFDNSRELSEAVQKFWKRELRVEPSSFFQATKNLKNRLYDQS